MIIRMVLSFIIAAPLYFYFAGTLQQWLTVGGILGVILILTGKVKELAENRRIKNALDQNYPRLETNMRSGRTPYPNNYGNYQPPVIIMPQSYQGQGGVQGQTQPPIPQWHDLPIERYELLS